MKKVIRVLHILESMNIGGAQSFIMNIYRNIDKDKIQFDFLVSSEGSYDDEIKDLGGKIYKIAYINKVGPYKYKKNIERFLLQHKEYNIIHSHLNQVSGIVLEAASEVGVQYKIAHSHSTKNLNNIFVKILKKYLQSKINKNSDYRIACSELAGKWLYKKAKFVIIPNVIDTSLFEYDVKKSEEIRKELNIKDDEILIGHVGRFSKVKNHKFLIKIFTEYHLKNPKSKLLLIGNGELRTKIKEMTKKNNINEYVIIKDECKDIYKYYNAMDVFLMPSLYEGIPLTLIEAQANGLKIVASDTINKDVNITGKVQFCSLSDSAQEWIKKIGPAKRNKRINEQNNIEKIKKSGYDLKIQTKNLENIYLRKELI